MERLRHTYRRRLAGLSDDELKEETRRVGERVERLKKRLHELEETIAALKAAPGTKPEERAAGEERRHELHAEHQRLYLDLTTDLFRKQAALSAEELRRWG
jgi:hypothetical protein